MLVLAQVSDTHFNGTSRNADRARAVMDYLHGLPGSVDALLVTGDIADHGELAEYETARDVLATSLPRVLCPGNHDDRTNLRKVLLPAGEPGDGPVNQLLELDGLVIALADSSVPGKPYGYLDDVTIAWLHSVLAAGRPTLIGMHHPPAQIGIPYMDEIGLRSPARLAEIVQRHSHVVGIVAGHAHAAAATTFAGVPLLVAPATCNTAVVPIESTAQPPVVLDLPPAVLLHVWEHGRLTTHTRTIPV